MSMTIINVARIVRWRDEVNGSVWYCVCSTPTPSIKPMPPSYIAADSSTSSTPRPFPTLSHAIQDGRYGPWKGSSSESTRSQFSNPFSSPFDDTAKTRSTFVNIQPRNEPSTCSNCNAFIDVNMTFPRFRRREDEGFKVRKWPSPRSETNLSYREPHGLHPAVNWYRSVKRHASKIETFRKLRKKIDAAFEDEKFTGKRVLKRPLSRLFKGQKECTSLPEEDHRNGPRATAMYDSLRSDFSSDPGSLGIEWSSDGEYRRPRPAIDDSAARLRRAHRLLMKGAES